MPLQIDRISSPTHDCFVRVTPNDCMSPRGPTGQTFLTGARDAGVKELVYLPNCLQELLKLAQWQGAHGLLLGPPFPGIIHRYIAQGCEPCLWKSA